MPFILRGVGLLGMDSEMPIGPRRELWERLGDSLTPQHLSAVRTKFGTTSFAGLKKGTSDEFLTALRRDSETTAVPGRFFGMPNYFRIGMGVNHEMFTEGLRRIARTLS